TGMVVFEIVAIVVGLLAGRSFGLATGWPIPHLRLGDHAARPRRSTRSPGRDRPAGGSRAASPGRSLPGRGSVVEGPWTAPPPPRRDTPDTRATQAELDVL